MFIRVYVRQIHFNAFRSPRRHNLKVPPRRRPTRSPGWKRSPKIRRFRPDPKHLSPSSQGHPSSTSPDPDRFDPKGRLPGVLVCQRYTFWPAANFKRETPSIPHPHISATDDLQTYVEASSKEFLMRSIYVVTYLQNNLRLMLFGGSVLGPMWNTQSKGPPNEQLPFRLLRRMHLRQISGTRISWMR